LPITITEVVVGNVLVHTMMSLDGFIAGPNDDMSWVFRYADDMPSAVVDEVIARTGAVLAGRRVYEVGRRVQRPEARGLFDGRWSGPHFILTHAPPTDETHPSYTFLSGDVRDAVATALKAADGRDVLVLGANVVDQCLGAGLVDEILMHLVPELVGDGVPLFDGSTLRASLTDARRVGIRSSREPAIASRQSGRVSTPSLGTAGRAKEDAGRARRRGLLRM
jgi:dihydrofolate reductase